MRRRDTSEHNFPLRPQNPQPTSCASCAMNSKQGGGVRSCRGCGGERTETVRPAAIGNGKPCAAADCTAAAVAAACVPSSFHSCRTALVGCCFGLSACHGAPALWGGGRRTSSTSSAMIVNLIPSGCTPAHSRRKFCRLPNSDSATQPINRGSGATCTVLAGRDGEWGSARGIHQRRRALVLALLSGRLLATSTRP